MLHLGVEYKLARLHHTTLVIRFPKTTPSVSNTSTSRGHHPASLGLPTAVIGLGLIRAYQPSLSNACIGH